MKHFFVSYTSADQQWAQWIAWQLEAAGYSVVIQAWDFRPGENFVIEMQRAASEAERTIAILSPNFLASRFTQPEWAAAFAQDPTGEKGIFVPVRVRECELTGLLPQIIYIDLVGADETTAKQRLLDGVKRGRAKPTIAPAFPQKSSEPAARAHRFPGTQPAIWNIPFPRNPNFTGRAELLQQLRDALTNKGDHEGRPYKTIALTQAIHGLGGVGKTQLAVEYAYRFAADYDIVWFVRAETTASISSDLALLAQPLQLPDRDARDQSIVVQAVREYLRQHERWLVILDNAEDPKDVRPLIPQGGHVLITSRNPNWGATAHALDVQVLPRDQAIEFLLTRTNSPSPVFDRGGGGGGSEAGELADALGCLPLALEQAGAYIETNGKTLAEYLQLYHTHQRELLNRPPATDYPATVATTWEIPFQQIERQAPASAGLLNLLAFFAPDAIPRDVIVAGAKHLPEPLQTAVRDEMQMDDAVGIARRYSLLQVGNGTFSMHRLVQTVARARMTDDALKQWAEAAAKIVSDVFPGAGFENDPTTWDTCARLLPHALAAADYAATLNAVPETTGRLFNQAALYRNVRAQFAEAKQLFEHAIKIDETAFGPNHPQVAIYINNLGSVLQDLGDLVGARAAFERALTIDETAFDPNHPNIATDVNNLGTVLLDLGDFSGARTALERTVKIFEDNSLEKHPDYARAVNNLGEVLQKLGDLVGARQGYERALKIDEAAFGPNHPNVARDINNLGGVLQTLGDLAGARKCFERALGIMKQSLGDNHPDVAKTMNNLGMVLYFTGNPQGGRIWIERAIKIYTQVLGKNHPTTVNFRKNLQALQSRRPFR